MKKYRTSEFDRARMKKRRDAIKAAGGEAYAALLERERAARAAYRLKNPDKVRGDNRKNRTRPFKTHLVKKARIRARKNGLDATITAADVEWPTRCPVLGIDLIYPERTGQQKDRGDLPPNYPSLDRLEPSKGYVPGNVFVISHRANMLKSNATLEEIEAVARYVRSALLPASSET
jgi:hypothetical protein